MSAAFHTIYDASSCSTWIADGAHRVARISPPRLRDIALSPGGSPVVTWLTLFWWQYVENETPGRSAWIIDEFSINEKNPKCYRLDLRSHNSGNIVESTSHLELTFHARRNSYIFNVSTELMVQPEKEWVIQPQGGIEFVNPWFEGAVGSAVEFHGATQSRWEWVLFTDPEGDIKRLPLNHLGTPPLENIRFPKSGGWLGFFNNPDGNPIIELEKDTSQHTRAEVCAWGYDVHFIRLLQTDTLQDVTKVDQLASGEPIIISAGQKIKAQYRMYSLQGKESKLLFERSKQYQLEKKLAEKLVRPAYVHPVNTFQEGVFPDKPNHRWYWSPSHEDGLIWDCKQGRTDNHSLHIHNTIARQSFWEVSIGKDFWMGPLPNHTQRLSCWIQAKNVKGGGAFIGFRYSNYAIETGQQQRYPEITTSLIKDTHPWKKLDLTINPPPPDATRAYLRLALDGEGDVWFDDLSLETIV